MKNGFSVQILGGLCLFLCLVKAISVQKKPYGPKMCEQFCEIAGCIHQFSAQHLSCIETFVNLTERAKRYARIQRTQEETTTITPIFGTSTTSQRLIQTKHEQQKETDNKGQGPDGLLVAPYVFKPNVFELNLQNFSVKKYPPMRRDRITALVYVLSIRKVIFGTEKTRQRLGTISAINLENQIVSVIRRSIITYNLAVDETRKEVFLATTKPSNDLGIYRMDYKGKNFQKVISIYSKPQALALDTAHEVIVVSFGYYVKTMTYTGKSLHVIDGDRTRAVALDYSGKFLYYNVKQTLQRWDRATETNTEIAKLHFTPDTFVLYKDTLYVSSFRETLVSAYDLREEKFVEVPKIHNELGNVMCLSSD